MSARAKLVSVFDFSGGIAGAGMLLTGVLLLVIAASSPQTILEIIGALLLLPAGLALATARQLRRVRIVIGAIVLALVIAALFLPIYV
jgi:hypothetical protein